MMIDARRRSGRGSGQPPSLGNKEVSADERNQPDDHQKNEAHVARPPEGKSRPSPLRQRIHPWIRKGGCKRRESTTAYCERKRVVAFPFLECGRLAAAYGRTLLSKSNGRASCTGISRSASKIPPQTRIDVLFHFE
jgi:hypothetical protein